MQYAKSLDHTLLALASFHNARQVKSAVNKKKLISAGIKHLTQAAMQKDTLAGIRTLEKALAASYRVKANDALEDDMEVEVAENLDDELDAENEESTDDVSVNLDGDDVDIEEEVNASLSRIGSKLRKRSRK